MDTLELELYIYLRIRWASTQGIRFWWKAFSSPQTWIRICEANPSDMRTKKVLFENRFKIKFKNEDKYFIITSASVTKKNTLQSIAYKWQSRINDAQRRRAVHQNTYWLLPRHSRVIWFWRLPMILLFCRRIGNARSLTEKEIWTDAVIGGQTYRQH